MKIAAITITFNDGYKLREWLDHYNEYKEALYLHVIVDNGSNPDYLNSVEQLFPKAVIIKRTHNGGTTAAYNEGIRYALGNKDADSIMLIGNDIRVSAESIATLHKILFADDQCGIIAPIIFQKNSDIISEFGSEISKTLYMKMGYSGKKVDQSLPLTKEVSVVAGGMNLAKRKFYEVIGLQDERLFMYSDEVDMALRMAKTHLKAVTTRHAEAWHQHINQQNAVLRQGYAEFLVKRNKIYLGYKHFGFWKAFSIFAEQILKAPIFAMSYYKKEQGNLIIYYLLGCFCGILKIQKNFRFIIDNKI